MINETASWILTVGILGELVFAIGFVVWISLTNRKWRKKQKTLAALSKLLETVEAKK